MKWTTKKILFFILHLIFSVFVPLILIIVEYSTLGNSTSEVVFAISSSGILLLLIVFYIFKKLIIDKRVDALRIQSGVMKADLRVEQCEDKKAALVRELRKIRTIEVVLASIIPILLLIFAILAARALADGFITLAGTLGFILISFCIGIVFNILYAHQIRGAKKKDDDKGGDSGK